MINVDYFKIYFKYMKMKGDIMDEKEVREALKDRRLTVVAENTGLSYPTVKRFFDGDKNFTINTLQTLREYLTIKE